MSSNKTCNGSFWTREQDKAFENALAIYFGDSDQWEKITAAVPGKTLEEIKHHYELLVEDVKAIESGLVPLPWDSTDYARDLGKGSQLGQMQGDSNHGKRSSGSERERRKGKAWSEEEHKLFLQGLDKHGKGDWRSISRNFVMSRTPTQVASHAQKYFDRLSSPNKARRRSSIHDITSVHDGETSAPLGPITGKMTGPAAAGTSTEIGKSPPSSASGVVYAPPTVGEPIQSPLMSAAGTPSTLPSPAQMVYSIPAPTPGSLTPGASSNMGYMTPMAHPMPPPSDQK